MLAYGIVAALLARERTGVGQEVSASLLGSMLSLQSMWLQSYLFSGMLPAKVPREIARNPFWNTYKAGDDKWFILSMARSDEIWEKFCRVFNLEELLNDPRFETHEKRLENGLQLIAIMDRVFQSYPREELLKLFDEIGVISAPVNTYDAVVADPQVIENEYVTEIDHPILGRCRVVGIPIHLSRTPAKVVQAAPQLGQHTEEILVEICGYSWDEIVELKEQGVII